MSSNNIPIAPIILSPNVSSGTTTKSGGTIIQRRQRNSQVNNNTSTVTNNNNTIRTSAVSGSSSLTSSYNHPHHQQQQQQHNSYYYGNNGRGMGDDPSSLQHQQQPPSPHVALHIETNTHHHHQYPNNNSEGVMDLLSSATHNHHYYHHHQYDADNNNYDPEQPQYPVSRSSSSFSAVNQVTEEQIRRFNDNHTYGQSSPYHTTTSPPATTSIPTATSFITNAARNIPIWKRKMVLEEDFYRIEDYHTIFRNPHHMTDAQYTKYVNQNNIDNNNNNDSTANTSMMNKTCCAYTCSVFSAIAVLFLLWIAILLDTQPMYIPGALPTITVQSVTQQDQQQQQLEQPLYTASSTTNQKNNYQQKQKGQNRQQQQQQQSQPRRTAPRIQFIIPGKNDERLLIAKTAYQAATMYFITMIISRYIYNPIPFHTFYNTYILSLFQACYRRITGQSPQQRHRHSYTDIPDSYDMIGHYASNASSLEGFILAGGGSGGNNTHGSSGNGISLLPYTTTTTQRSVWFSTAATNSLWTRTTHTMKRYLASKGWYQPSRRRRRHYEIKKTG